MYQHAITLADMKKRISIAAETGTAPSAGSPLDQLADALLAVQQPEEMRALLLDLCTPAELEALADRWRVVPLLLRGVPYREVHDQTAVSVTTVGRVARCLLHGEGGYLAAARHLGLTADSAAAAIR